MSEKERRKIIKAMESDDFEEKLKEERPNLDHTGLFINHTLWNRDSNRLYFFVRGGWSGMKGDKVNTPCSINADGTGLTLHDEFVGGHPEWKNGHQIIGSKKMTDEKTGKRRTQQVIYDLDKKKIVGQIGDRSIFPDPGADISLSSDGNWLANGYKSNGKNYYVVYRMSDGAFGRSVGIDKGSYLPTFCGLCLP